MVQKVFNGKQETVTIKDRDGNREEIKRLRLKVDETTFYYYSSANSWMSGSIFRAEYARISQYLRSKYPKRKFCLCLDNAPVHSKVFIFSSIDPLNEKI